MLAGAVYGLRRWGWRFGVGAIVLALIGAVAGFLMRPYDLASPFIGASAGFGLCALAARLASATDESAELLTRIKAAEEVATREPERAKPAWDVARITLEAYFRRNLRQIDMIFGLSLFVMVVGFAILIWGISQSLTGHAKLEVAGLATAAGVITEAVGGTFLLVYRSAIAQAVKYAATLERMNSVGMAMQILDTMNEPSERELTSKTKAELVKLLIKQVTLEKAKPKAGPMVLRLTSENDDHGE
jgi:hypothetical protein